jgi:hypothetical protein
MAYHPPLFVAQKPDNVPLPLDGLRHSHVIPSAILATNDARATLPHLSRKSLKIKELFTTKGTKRTVRSQ